MDNFGYRETNFVTKPSRRVRVKRSMSTQAGTDMATEEFLLNPSTYKNFSTFSVRRKKNDVKFDQEFKMEDLEYMLSAPSTSAENMSFSYEESSKELNEEIKFNAVKQTLFDFVDKTITETKYAEMKTIVNHKICTKAEIDMCMLVAALNQQSDLLNSLLLAGADVHFHDPGGMSALHLSAFVGCVKSTEILITKGADVDAVYKYFTPLHCAAFGNNPDVAKLLIDSGADTSINTTKDNCQENLLHCSVRADAIDCLRYFLSIKIADVNSIEASGANPIHLASELGKSKCLHALLQEEEADVNAKTRIRDKKSTALHLAAEEGCVDCLVVLLNKGADAQIKNHRGCSPLHLAAKASNIECIELLMRLGNSDPNSEDYDKRTPLHVAVKKADETYTIMKKLICWGADVNKVDEYGYSALHMAALDGLSECVELLIDHGADVSVKSNNHSTALSVIMKKTPASLCALTRKLDDGIVLLNSEDSIESDLEVRFDFRYIIHKDHPHEINFLETFVKEGRKEILAHPLCSAFLHVKWERVRKYYLARLFFCFTFVVFLSLYVLTALAHNCYNSSKDGNVEELCQKQSILGDLLRKNPFVIEMQWWFLAGVTIFEIFRKIYGIAGYSSFRQYFTQFQNLMDWFVIFSVFLISCIYTKSTHKWQNHVGSFAVLAGWTNLMFMVGQFPIFGSYVAMYEKVQKEFAKLFMAYACILIGFNFSFCVIFHDSAMFANPFVGFIDLLMMMIGEQDLSLLSNEPNEVDPPFLFEISAQVIYVLFLTSVTIVLMNLLVGIAVPDIKKLRKTAGLSKLVNQTMLISYMELALSNSFLPKFLKRIPCLSVLISAKLQMMKLNVEPLNPKEKRLPKDIIKAAYKIALKKMSNYNHFSNSKPKTRESTQYDENTDAVVKVENDIKLIKSLRNQVLELKEVVSMQKITLENYYETQKNIK